MMNRIWIVLLLALSLPLPLSWPAAAQEKIKVDLELNLMADGSGSIEYDEFLLQRRGYAKALFDRRVIDSIRFRAKGQDRPCVRGMERSRVQRKDRAVDHDPNQTRHRSLRQTTGGSPA